MRKRSPPSAISDGLALAVRTDDRPARRRGPTAVDAGRLPGMPGSRYRTLAVLAAFGLSACGGSSTGTPSRGTPTATSPAGPSATATPTSRTTPPASPTAKGTPSVLPPIVETGRVVFRASNGEACCIAVDPSLLPPNPGRGQTVLVLDDLPIGPGTVIVSGYTEDFAPAPADVPATCKTLNASGVKPCDPTRSASAAFESAPDTVTIIGGVRVNLGGVEVAALPFVLDFTPPQNTAVPLPVDFRFTVVDAETGIKGPSVALDITLDVPQGEPPVFRPLTKRVPLELAPCRDQGDRPCSPAGDMGLAGFKATGVAEYLSYLPAGPVDARITAQNLADPPRDLDFRYRFVVAPDPSPTPTPDAAVAATAQQAAGVAIVPTPTPTPTPAAP